MVANADSDRVAVRTHPDDYVGALAVLDRVDEQVAQDAGDPPAVHLGDAGPGRQPELDLRAAPLSELLGVVGRVPDDVADVDRLGMAPAVLVGREVDSRADIYSLAAVIFHAVTGQRPFTSRSWIETLSRRLYEPPPSSSDIVADLPEEFSQNLQQAMDRDPARRPASAGELLARLRATLDAPPQTEEKIHWLHPHMHRGSMVVSGVLVFLVGIAGVTWLLDGAGLSLMVKFSHVIGGH